MDEQQQKVIDSLKQATNILVTVKSNPSIDQLAACIALTLIVNELDKHGTAVFSGNVPSVLEFLEPEKTLEKNTDSLRDFIISLDKAKADKLRYKVEDTVVKIFITPYRTSLSSDDLEFGQGDFNVDVVVALGVHHQDDLDEAITAHGRILHDATVISVNTEGTGDDQLGSINWTDSNVSSLSEMIVNIADSLGKDDKQVIDNQIATALLTGIVAETERFGNAKTTPHTMEVAAKLLTAGANQELVATKLSEPPKPEPAPIEDHHDGENHDGGSGSSSSQDSEPKEGRGGELEIEHPAGEPQPAEHAEQSSPAEDSSQPDEATKALGADFAKEGADFEVPQEAGQQAEPSQPPEAGVPPVYNPTKFAPPAPHETEPEPARAEGAAGDQVDEKAALDFLKGRQVTPGPSSGARIEPLHDPREEAADLPKISRVVSDEEGKAQAPGNNDLDATKFALSPPTLGGTLTANMPSDHHEAVGAASSHNNIPAAKILTHDKPSVVAPAEPPREAAEKPVDQAAPQPPKQPEPARAETPSPAPVVAAAPAQVAAPPAVTAPAPAPRAAAGPAPKLEAAMAAPEPQPVAAAPKPEAAAPAQTGPAPKLEAAMADNVPPPPKTLAEHEKGAESAHPAIVSASQSGLQPTLEAGLLEDQPAGAVDMPKPAAAAAAPAANATMTHRKVVSPSSPPPPVPPPLTSPLSA